MGTGLVATLWCNGPSDVFSKAGRQPLDWDTLLCCWCPGNIWNTMNQQLHLWTHRFTCGSPSFCLDWTTWLLFLPHSVMSEWTAHHKWPCVSSLHTSTWQWSTQTCSLCGAKISWVIFCTSIHPVSMCAIFKSKCTEHSQWDSNVITRSEDIWSLSASALHFFHCDPLGHIWREMCWIAGLWTPVQTRGEHEMRAFVWLVILHKKRNAPNNKMAPGMQLLCHLKLPKAQLKCFKEIFSPSQTS